MKRHLTFLIMIMFFALYLTGCNSKPFPVNKNQDTQTPVDSADKEGQNDSSALTVEKIIEKYTDENLGKLVKTYDYKNYILVEYLNTSDIQCFDIYNLETGDRDVMLLGCNAEVFNFSSGDRIVFKSDGTIQQTGEKYFPYYLTCYRAKEINGGEDDFHYGRTDLYKSINEEVEFGVKSNEMICDLKVTLLGLELAFAPQKGKEADFYAGSTTIPVMKTSYEGNKNQFVTEIYSTSISPELLTKEFKEQNSFIDSVQIKEKGLNSLVIIKLKESAKFYTAEHGNSENFPYVKFIFKSNR